MENRPLSKYLLSIVIVVTCTKEKLKKIIKKVGGNQFIWKYQCRFLSQFIFIDAFECNKNWIAKNFLLYYIIKMYVIDLSIMKDEIRYFFFFFAFAFFFF